LYNQIRMKSTGSFLSRIFMKDEVSVRRVWPFFAILTVVVTGIFIWAVMQNDDLQRPGVFIPLIFLLLAHVLLHWLSPYLMETMRWTGLLLGVHGAVAFSLVMATGSVQLAYPVYMGLIGETVGIFQKNWQRAAGVLVYLGLSVFNLYLLGDRQALASWYSVVVPMTIFVVVYVILYTRETYARERAQELLEELEEANRQLAEYAGRIERLERERMARELHDTLAQGLAGLILQLEAVDSHLSSDHTERAQQIVQQAMQRARTTLADARRAIDNLRSLTSDSEDLAAALRDEISRFETATGVSCQMELALPDSIPAATGEHVLRMVSESLANIAHHAAANRARVKVNEENGCLLAEVSDDGVGFAANEGIQGSGHYGLLGMRERTRLAGGSLEIESQIGAGTVLRLRLPL
jgi:two-component system, NarL family, sensor histidine kinase YdfH